jgi:hypothetical protein
MTLSSTRPAPTMLIARRVSLAHRACSALYCFLQDAFAFLPTALYCNNSPSAKLTVRSPGHILRPKQASGNRGIGTTTPWSVETRLLAVKLDLDFQSLSKLSKSTPICSSSSQACRNYTKRSRR